jgi:hypothetical protein
VGLATDMQRTPTSVNTMPSVSMDVPADIALSASSEAPGRNGPGSDDDWGRSPEAMPAVRISRT